MSARDRIKEKAIRAVDKMTDAEVRRAEKEPEFAHDWLQDVIGWIGGLRDMISDWWDNDDCFITTAVVNYLRLPDDCDLLQTLRHFRNEYILSSKDAEKLVDLKTYYAISPVLIYSLKSMNKPEADVAWNYLISLVQNAANKIKENQYESAYNIYKNGVLKFHRFVILIGKPT
jgi:hypothetical protein